MIPWPAPAIPEYRKAAIGDWRCSPTPRLDKSPGYWSPFPDQPPGWMFKRKRTVWMSLTQMELESHQPHIAAAKGRVVVAGLGMGLYLYNVLRKPAVTHVTVLEQDPSVIALLRAAADFDRWPGAEKLTIWRGDALQYVSTTSVDFLYADIWARLGSDDALPFTRTIYRKTNAKEVGYWGQEFDYLDWLRMNKIPWTEASMSNWRAFVRSTELPLIGGRWPDYPELAAAAVVLQALASQEGRRIKGAPKTQILEHIYRLHQRSLTGPFSGSIM